jgi:hypothetical protein
VENQLEKYTLKKVFSAETHTLGLRIDQLQNIIESDFARKGEVMHDINEVQKDIKENFSTIQAAK